MFEDGLDTLIADAVTEVNGKGPKISIRTGANKPRKVIYAVIAMTINTTSDLRLPPPTHQRTLTTTGSKGHAHAEENPPIKNPPIQTDPRYMVVSKSIQPNCTIACEPRIAMPIDNIQAGTAPAIPC